MSNKINIFKIKNNINNISSTNGYKEIYADEKHTLLIQENKESQPSWINLLNHLLNLLILSINQIALYYL